MSEPEFHKRTTLHETSETKIALPSIPIPEKIGPYKIESLLETGGMSQVYLATHPETKEPVTIKVLLPKFLSNPEVVERFLNEAEIIALADHPNIVKLYGQGNWEEGLYIAMEFIHGISLRQYIQHNPLSLKRSLEIVLEISYALCHLHTHGVIHRDLKLENILLTDAGEIKVIDFGIAQVLSETASITIPNRSKIIGTPIYMSPEQRENPEAVSYPSDIYSLGIITYELILGKLSHGHIHLSLMPKGMQKILTKALQPVPDDRYQDIVDFIADVSSYLNSTMVSKERKTGDQISEVIETIHAAHNNLIPQSAPKWPKVEFGAVNYRGNHFANYYYDFFEFSEDCYGFAFAESPLNGPEAVMYIANFRGLLRMALKMSRHPKDLAVILNETVIRDPLDQVFSFSFVIFNTKSNSIQFISCGNGNLWVVPAGTNMPRNVPCENPPLGIDQSAAFNELILPWYVGDQLQFNNIPAFAIEQSHEKEFTQEFFKHALIDNLFLPPQKQLEIILRKIKAVASRQVEEQSFVLISMLRHE